MLKKKKEKNRPYILKCAKLGSGRVLRMYREEETYVIIL